MAAYDFRIIDDAGNDTPEIVELRFPMGDRPEMVTLPDGRTARFDFSTTAKHVKTEQPKSGQVLWAFSTTPNQVDEYRRRHPNRTYLDNGYLVSNSWAETKRIVSEEGCVDKSAFAPVKNNTARHTLMRVSHA